MRFGNIFFALFLPYHRIGETGRTRQSLTQFIHRILSFDPDGSRCDAFDSVDTNMKILQYRINVDELSFPRQQKKKQKNKAKLYTIFGNERNVWRHSYFGLWRLFDPLSMSMVILRDNQHCRCGFAQCLHVSPSLFLPHSPPLLCLLGVSGVQQVCALLCCE